MKKISLEQVQDYPDANYYKSHFVWHDKLNKWVRARIVSGGQTVNKDDVKLRYRYLNLPLYIKNNKDYYVAFIYTPEEALELNINFRDDWWIDKPNTEREYFSNTIYCQKDDWCITQEDSFGNQWVVQILWRNNTGNLCYSKTATGLFPNNERTIFVAEDKGSNGNFGTARYAGGKKLTAQQKLMASIIANLIVKTGYFDIDIIKIAWKTVYKHNIKRVTINDVLRSDKIMNEIAKELKKALGNNNLDINWVVSQLKEMGESDWEKAPDRRLEVVKIIARMNEVPVDDFTDPKNKLEAGVQFMLPNSNIVAPSEDLEDFKELQSILKEPEDSEDGQ
jgi:hypothetical protein